MPRIQKSQGILRDVYSAAEDSCHLEATSVTTEMNQSRPDQGMAHRRGEKQSLDVVQRAIISVLIGVVFGLFAAVLAAYLVAYGDQDLARGDVIGLWVMAGVVGLLTAAAILVVNRRRPYSPLVLLGLLPMAISGFWIFD
jgi:uncharacterized membrane protein (UPF0136 family)